MRKKELTPADLLFAELMTKLFNNHDEKLLFAFFLREEYRWCDNECSIREHTAKIYGQIAEAVSIEQPKAAEFLRKCKSNALHEAEQISADVQKKHDALYQYLSSLVSG